MSAQFHVSGDYQPLMRMLALDAGTVFEHPDIVCWRRLPDRENCTLDADLPDGRHVRLHVKRYPPAKRASTPADDEARGHQLLLDAGIPTAPLVGWGKLPDGRSFVIFDDLSGYKPADKLIEAGALFARLLEPTADLAAKLHNAGLHHRDLYLCHFMAASDGTRPDVKLIDPARVRPIPRLLASRWIVKDLAQFWYSTLRPRVTDEQRLAWLHRYSSQRQITHVDELQRRVERKARSIARHDVRLHRSRPQRDVSIPSS